MRPTFKYFAVSGPSIWTRNGKITTAKRAVEQLRKGIYPGSGKSPEAEIERMLVLGFGRRWYRRWRNGSWSTKTWTSPTEIDLKKWG